MAPTQSLNGSEVALGAAVAANTAPQPSALLVWLVGVSCVTVIALSGAIGVLLKPMLSTKNYARAMTFSVGLGVGSLTGGAIFHLLPHGFKITDKDHLLAGWIVIGGMYLFFFTDKFLKIYVQHKKQKADAAEYAQRQEAENGGQDDAVDGHSSNMALAELTSRHVEHGNPDADFRLPLFSSFTGDKDDDGREPTIGDAESILDSYAREGLGRPIGGGRARKYSMLEHAEFVELQRASSTRRSRGVQCRMDAGGIDNGTVATAAAGVQGARESNSASATAGESPQAPAHVAGASSHGHSHHISVPSKGGIKSVAWMILCGDSLHTFIDGMTIGAAFTTSLMSGISIAMVLICEELPHGMGDVAILIMSGLSTGRTFWYKYASSLPMYAGLAVGIALGEVQQAGNVMVCLASGMFLYVSLACMIPEMNEAMALRMAAKHMGAAVRTLVLQSAGVFAGLALMSAIAYYSDYLETVIT